MKIYLYTDGASRGNPGPAGAGVIIYDESGNKIEQHYEYLGNVTNNTAEYLALIIGLKLARKYVPCSLEIFSDSELLIKQLYGEYRVKNENLKKLFNEVQILIKEFSSVVYTCIPREKNKLADSLANKAINLQVSGNLN